MNAAGRAADRILHWFALAVTDRRWAAPLTGMALGFGIFVGIAVGPQAQGSLATSAPMIVQVQEPSPEPAPVAETEATTGSRPAGTGNAGAGAGVIAPPAAAAPAVADAVSTPPPVTVAPTIPEASADAGTDGSSTPADEAVADEAVADESASDDEEQQQEDEGEANGHVLTGTVVHLNPGAASYALATREGTVYAIHAKRLPRAGVKLEVPIRELVNGTYGENGKRRKLGEKSRVALTGIVTFVDSNADSPAYALSVPGASPLIHLARGSGAQDLPDLGDSATVEAVIVKRPDATVSAPPTGTGEASTSAAGRCEANARVQAPRRPKMILRERSFERQSASSAVSDIAGVVSAVCPGEKQILLSADDVRESGQDVLLSVPDEIDLSIVRPDDSVVATVEISKDGSMTLTRLASDERLKGADDAALIQGDLETGGDPGAGGDLQTDG